MNEPRWLHDAVALIERHYQRRLSLAVVARAVGVPRATMATAFRRCRGKSVGMLIREVRIRRATEILIGTAAPIHEVAQQTGFFDQAHFARVFRRLTGTTPIAFRRSRI